MTGVGAVFELISALQWGKKKDDDDEKKDEVVFDPEEESVLGYRNWESEWHYAIQDNNWDKLEELLKNYDFKLYKPKEPEVKKKSGKQLRLVGIAKRAGNTMYSCIVSKKEGDEEEEDNTPKSPLLGKNGLGLTPLHLAIQLLAPDKLIIRMVFAEKRAAAVLDDMGQLPLHRAACRERSEQVIDRLCRAYRTGIQQEDSDGKTALWYLVHMATEEVDNNKSTYWGIPRNSEEIESQRKQEQIWSKVRFMLLTYSTRKRILIESERDLLLMALEHAAPPSVVELILRASQKELKHDPTLASEALAIFMQRAYPIKNLELLLHHFPVKNVQSMEAARKLLTKHYHLGCKTLPGREIPFREEMEKMALQKESEEPYKPSLACQEWWEKTRAVLRLCGHGNEEEERKNFKAEHLLHAALSNCDTPPSLVQLLMVLRPESVKVPHPGNGALLIHLCCQNWKYNLFPHSKDIGVDVETKEPEMEQVLRILMHADQSALRKPHRGRLPLHYAIATSKSLNFLQSILKLDTKLLSIRDPVTRLFPFQLAALTNPYKNPALWAHDKRSGEEWKKLTADERAAAVQDIIEEQDLEQLTCMYVLLREFPLALSTAIVLKKPAVFRDANGHGMVSAHYTLWCYEELDEVMNGEHRWELHSERLEVFQDAIVWGEIPESMETWWGKLKFWIWYCYPKNLPAIPREDKYLLHAAVANPDTPPMIVELLVSQFPKSASIPIGKDYPLHIAARTPSYMPQDFECDVGNKMTLEIVAKACPEAATIASPRGLPVEIARESGKTWVEIDALVKIAEGRDVPDLGADPNSNHYVDDTDVNELRGIIKEASNYLSNEDIHDVVPILTSDDSEFAEVDLMDSQIEQVVAEDESNLKKGGSKKVMKGTY